MKNENFKQSFKCALTGIVSAFEVGNMMKFYCVAAFIMLVIAKYINVTKTEFGFVILANCFLTCAGLMSLAIERLVDFVSEEYDGKHKNLNTEIRANYNFKKYFKNAIEGICSAFKTERNLKFHCVAAIVVIGFSIALNISRSEFESVMLAICFVIGAELLNTAIERLVDLVTKEYNENAKFIKDVAAGAVLIAAVNALFTGYIVFFGRIVSMFLN